MKRMISLVLAFVLTLSLLPVISPATEAEEISGGVKHITESTLNTLAENLPKVTDITGADYYFYNQLTNVEKAFYWLIKDATLDTPTIMVTNLKEHTFDGLSAMAGRALTAVVSDDPAFHMMWSRYGIFEGTDTEFKFTLNLMPIWSEYRQQKAEARIQQLVEIIGPEGDRYSKVRDMLDLMANEMDYYGGVVEIADCAIGCLIYDYAVCAGFSDTVKILCSEMEIPCIVIGNAGHAWNYIQMEDGLWYAVDASRDISFDFVEEPVNLVGRNSPQYAGEGSYSLSEPYIAAPGDFTFPELAEAEYIYSKKYIPSYHEVPGFVEPAPTFAYNVNPDGETCTITSYEGSQSGDLVIPANIDGYTVTAIGDYAFHRCVGFTGDLIIPDAVTYIGKQSFDSCWGFKGKLKLPSSLKVIGEKAFFNTYNFTGDLILPNGLTSIGKNAFYYVGFEGELFIPDGLYFEPETVACSKISAFSVSETNPNHAAVDGILYSKDLKTLIACPSYKSGELLIPDGVEIISTRAFLDCNQLTGELILPESLKIIEENAFGGCSGFSGDLIIPDSVQAIGPAAFILCGGFNGKLKLPAELTRIEDNSFSVCNFTGDLYIPNTVTYIGNQAFFGLKGRLFIPDSVEYIGSYAFEACSFTNSVDLSKSNVKIMENAFFGTSFGTFSCNCDVEMNCDVTNYGICGTERYYICPFCVGQYIDEELLEGHKWQEADCNQPKQCVRCIKQEGEKLGHDYKDGTCIRCKKEEKFEGDTGIYTFYDGHYYRIFSRKVSWTEAKNICETLGGHLATLTGNTENKIITELSQYMYLWIGAELDENSLWSWVTDEEWKYTGWRNGEPSGRGENRVLLDSGGWNDVIDTYKYVEGFICEWDDISLIPNELEFDRCKFLGHVLQDATCISPAVCTVCNTSINHALGHEYKDNICIRCKNECKFEGYDTGIGTNINGHYYRVFFGKSSWSDAQYNCEILGGHLVTITGKEELEIVSNLYPNRFLWIGATLNNNNLWSWVSDEPWEYSNWMEGEPSGNHENRGILYTKFANEWNDVPEIYSLVEGYICEWDELSKVPLKFRDTTNFNNCDNGHNWEEGTCTTPKTCKVCGTTSGGVVHAYEHQFDYKCDLCGETRTVDMTRPMVDMFRMYDPNSGEHFYTGSMEERENLVAVGWNYEGVGFTFPLTTGKPVHRLYDPVTGEHLYTMDENEMNMLLDQGWNYEGIAFNSGFENEVPQYRLHNPNATRGAYHFTASIEERDTLLALGWEDQGIGWYSLGA